MSDNINAMSKVAAASSIIWKEKILIAIAIIIALFVALGYLFLAKPVYRADVLIMPAEQGKHSSLLGDLGVPSGIYALAGINANQGSHNTKRAMAILKSRSFTEEFAKSENLLAHLFADRWDDEKGLWKTSKTSPPTAIEIYSHFNRIRTVASDADTGLIRVSIEWEDAKLATQWANALITGLNEHMRNIDIDNSLKSIEFIKSEISKNNLVATEKILYGMMENHLQTIVLANVNNEYAFKIIDRAVINAASIKPKKKLIIILFAWFGFVSGVFIVALKHLAPYFKAELKRLSVPLSTQPSIL